mgnify:CR=1 FL=1
MKRFWSRICGFVSEHDLFFRLFLILFGCIILPVSIACIAFNWQAENLVRTQTERTNSAYLTSLSTQLESALNAQRMQMLDYSVKETLTGSFRSNKFTKDATTLLTNALSSNENLEAVFVLDPGTNRIASNIGCFDAEIYFSKYCRFPGYSFEELYGTLCENRAFSFIGALDYTRYSLVKNRQDSRALLLLYTYFPEQSYGTNRVMGFVLSPSLAEALLDDRFLERQGDICIFDAAGAPVCSTFAQTDSLPLFDDSEVHNCRIGDTDYQVQSLSGAYGLRYISVIPTSEYYSGLQPIRSFTLLLILILLVLIVLALALGGKLPREMPLTVILVLVLAVLGLLLWLVYMGTPFVGKGAGKKEVTDWSFLRSTRFWLLTGLLFCQNAAEQSVTGWMVTYFKGSGIIAGALAAYTVTVMWGATLVARLLIAFVFPFKQPRKAMVVMGVSCTIFYILLVQARSQGAAIVLLFAFAFAMAGMNPTAVASAGRMTSVTSMGIMLPVAASGAILMPWVIGVVAESAGLAAGMMTNIVPCVGLVIFAILVARLPEE